MNNARRKQLSKIAEGLACFSWLIEEVMKEEKEYLRNMPKSIREGKKNKKGWEIYSGIQAMDAATGFLEEAMSLLAEAQS